MRVNDTSLYSKLINLDKSPYEKLNIKLCKQSLRVPRRTSNLASRAELGRLPMAHSIIVALLKYNLRSKLLGTGELLAHAFSSQSKRLRNSYNTLTYSKTCTSLIDSLGIPLDVDITNGTIRTNCLKRYGNVVKIASIKQFRILFRNNVNLLDNESRLSVYGSVKREYLYEKYLDMGCQHISDFTKFRMSIHWLPIERGRYCKPKIPRDERLCYFCKQYVGTEYHVLMECNHSILKDLRENFLSNIFQLFPIMVNWPPKTTFQYIMLGIERDILRFVTDWITQCNRVHKEKGTG